jgi:hypothetical protein
VLVEDLVYVRVDAVYGAQKVLHKRVVVLVERVLFRTVQHDHDQIVLSGQQIQARLDQLSNGPFVTKRQRLVVHLHGELVRFTVVIDIGVEVLQELAYEIKAAYETQQRECGIVIYCVNALLFFIVNRTLHRCVPVLGVFTDALFNVLKFIYEIGRDK